MKMRLTNRTRWLVLMIVLLCGIFVVPVSAQAAPVNIGENKTGELTPANPVAEFSIVTGALQSARAQILALTPGFAPSFTVTDATNGIPLLSVGTGGAATRTAHAPSGSGGHP